MENQPVISKHSRIQREIIQVCQNLNIKAIQEFTGKGWRADVYIPNEFPIAFEIQISPQSLKKTLERQAKYFRDGVKGCWLFENPVSKLNEERPDLPLFYVQEGEDSELYVLLGDRRILDLHEFIGSFISNKIKFKPIAKTSNKQIVRLVFFKMDCWKCHEVNHLFYVDTPFYSSCNAEIKPEEALWGSDSMAFIPEIIDLAQKFINSQPNLKMGQIKKRFSKTVGESYTSFGCYKCDSIFGDWYVMEAKIDIMYEPHTLCCEDEIQLKENIILEIPHWCYPDNNKFCDE